MTPDVYLLDTSALFTLIEGEKGVDRVREILRGGKALLPWMALLEVSYVTRREVGPAEAERRYALMTQLPARVLWDVEPRLILSASALKAEHRISLADAVIAAQARAENAVLVHKDPEYEALEGLVPLEPLPYKRPART